MVPDNVPLIIDAVPTPEQRKDSWLLYKARTAMFSVKKASETVQGFREVYERWKAKEATNEEFLPLLRAHVPCPDMSGPLIAPKRRR